jgi:AraC-like DNA-binding protein
MLDPDNESIDSIERLAAAQGELLGDTPAIVYIAHGRARCVWPDRRFDLLPGTTIVSDGKVPWRVQADPDHPPTILRLRPASGAAGLIPVCHESDSACSALMRSFEARLMRKQHAPVDPPAPWFESFLAAQAELEAPGRRCAGRSGEHWQEKLVRLCWGRTFLSQAREDVSVAAAAALARMSTFHFARLFKHVFDEPPHRLRRRSMLGRARVLVTDSFLPMRQIAQAIGFSSVTVFSRAFRREFGQCAAAMRVESRRTRRQGTGTDEKPEAGAAKPRASAP